MCNFSRMIKNVLPSLRQRAGPQRICSRQKSIRSGTARNSFSQTPHMRGKDDEGRLKLRHVGITPAHAGKSLWASVPPVYGPGSPPHVRGKAHLCVATSQRDGITPACAGKRRTPKQCVFNSRDHPRVCGEKLVFFKAPDAEAGSPPHVRGKGWQERSTTANRRITPACAGKSTSRSAPPQAQRDHPRMCGEKTKKIP